MTDIISKVIPILMLISFGLFLRRKHIISRQTVDEIKNVVVNISLSAVLFLAFINLELKEEYFLLIIIVFFLMIVLYLAGLLANLVKPISHPMIPFITTGFTFGLLGIPLFTTVFGVENAGKLSLIGIGHEFYIWLVFYTLMEMRFQNEKLSIKFLTRVVTSPVIVSIMLGVLFNVTGLGAWLIKNPVAAGFLATIEYLASLATPLILIIVGYGLQINKEYLSQSIKFVAVRLIIVLTIGYAFKFLLIDKVLMPDKIFDYAYFTFLILPPPLALSIFVGKYSTEEHEKQVNNMVVLNTMVSVAIFIVFVLLTA